MSLRALWSAPYGSDQPGLCSATQFQSKARDFEHLRNGMNHLPILYSFRKATSNSPCPFMRKTIIFIYLIFFPFLPFPPSFLSFLRQALCTLGCPGTHSMDQAGLKLKRSACFCLCHHSTRIKVPILSGLPTLFSDKNTNKHIHTCISTTKHEGSSNNETMLYEGWARGSSMASMDGHQTRPSKTILNEKTE